MAGLLLGRRRLGLFFWLAVARAVLLLGRRRLFFFGSEDVENWYRARAETDERPSEGGQRWPMDKTRPPEATEERVKTSKMNKGGGLRGINTTPPHWGSQFVRSRVHAIAGARADVDGRGENETRTKRVTMPSDAARRGETTATTFECPR
ncbi:hypothetical protein EDB84DRAFT_1438870 [Lactarius hengduanensis]|nr:hypothetical protein EDB84DRAFT_1438870 [Lactarius hengduanensis]